MLLRGSGRPCVVEDVEVYSEPYVVPGAVIVRYRGAETSTGLGWESFPPDELLTVAKRRVLDVG